MKNFQKEILQSMQKLKEGTDRDLKDLYRFFDEKTSVKDFLKHVYRLEDPIDLDERSIANNDPPDLAYYTGQHWWGFEVTMLHSKMLQDYLRDGGKLLADQRRDGKHWMKITAFQNKAAYDPLIFSDDVTGTIEKKGQDIIRWEPENRIYDRKILIILMILPFTSVGEGHNNLLQIPHDEFRKHDFPDRGFFSHQRFNDHGFNEIYLYYGYEPEFEQVYERLHFNWWTIFFKTIKRWGIKCISR